MGDLRLTLLLYVLDWRSVLEGFESLSLSARFHAMSRKKTNLERLKIDQQAIIDLVAERETAWNAGDTEAYAQLLTDDADILSATGRPARGREALLKLYAEQHANVFAGVRTTTTVTHVRLLGKDVALADVDYQLEGGKVDTIRRGIMAFIVRKEAGRWRIAAIRSIPGR